VINRFSESLEKKIEQTCETTEIFSKKAENMYFSKSLKITKLMLNIDGGVRRHHRKSLSRQINKHFKFNIGDYKF
jgi:hypothetical protein